MTDIKKELAQVSEKMAKSHDLTIPELVQALGKEGLKKAMEKMDEKQLAVLKVELKNSVLVKHVPGVPDEKFDSCVDDVKAKEGGKVNAYAVCTASLKGKKKMKKADTTPDGEGAPILGISEAAREENPTKQKKKEEKQVSLPKKDFIAEHKHLVDVLETGSKKEQKKEARDQAKELKDVKKSKKKMKKSLATNARTSEPIIATDRGGKMLMNENIINQQDTIDELAALDAMMSPEMRDIRHQGGPEQSASWEGAKVEDPMPERDWEAEAMDLKSPISENLHSVADKIVELNALGLKTEAERMEMRKQIMAIIERMMARQLEKSVCIKKISKATGVDKKEVKNLWKSMELNKSTKLEKASEGSRGGQVIGHTKAGKPIYSKADHQAHAPFNEADHYDAMMAHRNRAVEHANMARGLEGMGKPKKAMEHKEKAMEHFAHAREHEKNWRAMTPGLKKSQEMKEQGDLFYYDGSEMDFYLPKPHNPFHYRDVGQNYHANVDAYIELVEAKTEENLNKSKFMGEHKAIFKSASVEDLIAKGQDMDSADAETIMALNVVKPKGVNLVKSFSEADLDDLFVERDSWGNAIKKAETQEEMARKKKPSKLQEENPMNESGSAGQGEYDAAEERAEEKAAKEADKVTKADMSREEAKDKLMAMEEKEHGTKDPKKLIESEKKEHEEYEAVPKKKKEVKKAIKKEMAKCGGYDMLAKELMDTDDMHKAYIGFDKLKEKIARRGDVKDPAAVAAAVGRKKYGKKKFQQMAAAGKK